MTRERARRVTEADIAAFAQLSGDRNPVHLDEEFAAGTRFGGVIAHGMFTAALVSAVLGEELPGPGAVYLSQNLSFRAPVRPGDLVVARCAISEIRLERRRVAIACVCLVGETVVLDGEARILAPTREEVAQLGTGRREAAAA